ncbi:MAG: aminotransferase class IV family protein [Planctomycetes bacterium]|nr:aminotransferase class IV family protein [Planctomycetota bacterium]
MSEQIYLNGQLLTADQARLPVSNPAFLHGVGLFETLRTYGGRPFRLVEHVERLQRSAKRFNMPVGDAVAQIPDAVERVLWANRLQDARVRITVTPPGSTDEAQQVTLLVRAEATRGYPPELYERGMTVCVVTEYRQSRLDPLAGHKTTCYFPRLLALRDAQDRHCNEALWFTPDNLLAEGCMSNVFIVQAGRVKTPQLDTPVLPGVTRAAVIELARRENVPVDESPCTIDDLLEADEVFLTNAIMEVMPVTRVERHAIGSGKPGPIARALAAAYNALTAS